MHTIAFVLFISVTIFVQCLCHPYGAPKSQCGNMKPEHGPIPQTGASPYDIRVTKSYYVPGENVKVSIKSSSNDIKGYLIQARKVGENQAIGTFAALPTNGKYVNCGNSKGAITHSTILAVKAINFNWMPPSSLSGNVSFYATVVKDVATYWVKLQSPELYKREMLLTSTQPPSGQGSATTDSTSTSMMNSTSDPPTAMSTCKSDDPKCDAARLNHSILVFILIGFMLAFWQNVF